jgi:hypothetical protein
MRACRECPHPPNLVSFTAVSKEPECEQYGLHCEACLRRERIQALLSQPGRTPGEVEEGLALWEQWRAILGDELANARQARGVARSTST